jgi:hypothetical protein
LNAKKSRAPYSPPEAGGVAAHQENIAKRPLKAQTGWSFWTDHPVRAYQRMPSAISLDGTATPPVPGGDYVSRYSVILKHPLLNRLTRRLHPPQLSAAQWTNRYRRPPLVTTSSGLRDRTKSLMYEAPALQAGLIVVGSLLGPFGKLHFVSSHFLVLDKAQQMRDAVEPRPLLVVGSHDVPRRKVLSVALNIMSRARE